MFAWTQNRTLLPAWYGCGSAFAGQSVDVLRSLYRDLPLFRSLVDNLEMTLAKSSLEIAANTSTSSPLSSRTSSATSPPSTRAA